MNDVVGLVGKAIPKPNDVFAPKKRWKVVFVRGSTNGAVVWAKVEDRRVMKRRVVDVVDVLRVIKKLFSWMGDLRASKNL